MRKLVMWNLMSLDGFIEGPNRVTYEQHWTGAAIPRYVPQL